MSIAQYYKGKNVFVTGATGFMGKCLVEKLVRTFPDVSNVFLMIRDHPKHGTYKHRCKVLLKNSVFNRLRMENPSFAEKITPIYGDIQLPGFGIKADDVSTLNENVNIVVHFGGTVNFKMPIREAVRNRVVALADLSGLCRQFLHLESLVHISSIGVTLGDPGTESEEKLQRADTSELLSAYANNDDSALAEYERQTKGDGNMNSNVYASTKNIGENVLVENCAGQLPLAIIRPSLVHASLREPYPGWMDCPHGLAPMLEQILTGERTSVFGNPSACVDIIPVDLSINLCLAVAWYLATHLPPHFGSSDPPIFHSTSGLVNPILQKSLYSYVQKFASSKGASVPPMKIYTNFEDYKCDELAKPLMSSFEKNCRPAPGHEEDSEVRKVRYRYEYNRLISPAFAEHTFRMDNVDTLMSLMTPADRKLLPLDPRLIDWEEYIQTYCRQIQPRV